MNPKHKIITVGILRTLVTVLIVGVVMWLMGELENRKWILYLSMAVLPWYYVYLAFFKKNTN